jgi:hypothetical protein
VGHGELTRDVQGRGEGEDEGGGGVAQEEGWCSGPSSCSCWEEVNAKLWTQELEVRDFST